MASGDLLSRSWPWIARCAYLLSIRNNGPVARDQHRGAIGIALRVPAGCGCVGILSPANGGTAHEQLLVSSVFQAEACLTVCGGHADCESRCDAQQRGQRPDEQRQEGHSIELLSSDEDELGPDRLSAWLAIAWLCGP